MSQLYALIIDDNARNTSVLTRLLAEQGVNSTQLMDPKQLDTVLESVGSVDVIFLDLEMPGLDGYEVLAKLHAVERFRNVPVVACTVHVSEIHVAYRSGFHSFIGKPVDPDRFPEQLARILSGIPVWETI